MGMNFVNKFVEVLLVAATKINEGLDSLIRVCRNVLALGGGEDGEHIVKEGGEIGNGVVDVGGFVHPDQGLVEDCKKVAEEMQGDWLLDNAKHHSLIPLSSVHLQKLFELGEKLCALLHFIINLPLSVVP